MLISEIGNLYHPSYLVNSFNWQKWRLTYQANDLFIQAYLKRFPDREDYNDFQFRQALTYVPAFAKAAINEIKNSIFERTIDIVRQGGPQSYQDAVEGLDGGVDLRGSSMSFFIGQKILPELLTMQRVGVFVDMPAITGTTLVDQLNKRPYLYYYPVEDIRVWANTDQDHFDALVLRDTVYELSPEGLPIGQFDRYRHLWMENGKVYARYYNNKSEPYDDIIELNIPRIPFVLLELSDSLLADVANYQIALMNLASSDMVFSLLANYPFYTEQFDAKNFSPYLNDTITTDGVKPKDEAIVKTGPTRGRRYTVGTERPGFIAPPSGPLEASMKKQHQLKEEIYALVQLAVTNISPVRDSSAQAKAQESKGLEAGLSYIGMVLEYAEREIGKYWSIYENIVPPTIIYPEEYSLPNNEETRKQNEQDLTLADSINSITFKKEVVKRICKRAIGTKISAAKMQQIQEEIDDSTLPYAIPASLSVDLEKGLVSNAFASEIRGYPKDQVDAAKVDQAERLALIQAAQTPHADGVTNTNGKLEKQKANDTTTDVIPTDKTRGNGKL